MKTNRGGQLRGMRGIVMLDALISIVVFSIGILGMIHLQASAVQMAADAKYRTDAAMLADQIIGQMWGDDPKTLSTNFGATSTNYQLWAKLVAKTLPGVDATTNVPTISFAANNLVTVTVKWQPPKGSSNDANAHSYVSITQITR